VIAAAGLAGTAAAVPVPFAAAAIAKITTVYGLELADGFLKSVLAATVGPAAAAIAGRAIVTELLKFVPGMNVAAGGSLLSGKSTNQSSSVLRIGRRE
jgi:uncharacterized protein (DUF697 family)